MNHDQKVILGKHKIYVYRGTIFENSAEVLCEAPLKIGGEISFKGSIGAYTYIRKGCRLSPGLKSIGRYCSIAPDVKIGDGNHPTTWLSTSPFQWGAFPVPIEYPLENRIVFEKPTKTITIGNDVWIGTNVTITPNVTIGDGAIIAAGAVVVKDVEPYSIVGGVPAQVIRYRFDDKIIERLLKQQWWRFAPDMLSGISFDNPELALDEIDNLINNKKISEDHPSIVKIGPMGVIL
ncbi:MULTISPECIES: CatB-related O-acetyltransferase [unclassified Gilliamella]|uniref:CatB-related O-acetyltransferase n=1 Tax=unclassified Gilliamella TaxID=2685620 RepID=UPI00080DB294|nr:CatB-related O-acetyltransferase [Gilliamella apicola]OCG19217.1 hypothetical protein A9G23_09790 [Gilliamella apicola]OCG21277.1 hypothetical protein A9G22_09860 [Gilliamella apicola]